MKTYKGNADYRSPPGKKIFLSGILALSASFLLFMMPAAARKTDSGSGKTSGTRTGSLAGDAKQSLKADSVSGASMSGASMPEDSATGDSVEQPTATISDDLDKSIIREALAGTVCSRNIAVIVEGAYYQNSRYNNRAKKPQRHFETDNLERSVKYMNSERKKVLNAALEAGSNTDMRTRTLFHFGMLLHTANAFYLNSNYIEKTKSKLEEAGKYDFDPYELALVDWSKAGEPGLYRRLTPRERQKRKNKKLRSTTVERAARGLAIKEVRRQWDMLEGLLRSKYFGKADIIVAALKAASCEKLIPEYAEEHGLHAQEAMGEF